MHAFGEASFPALGTTAQILTTREACLSAARAALERELADIDRACSRFRDDSELSRVNARAGQWVLVSPLFVEALRQGVRAAELTDGTVVPTVGLALESIGYDRDFASIEDDGASIPAAIGSVPSWRAIELDERIGAVKVPPGARIDLGATAKALASDRAARAAHNAAGCGVLVNLGGDIAVAGPAPDNGWRITIADDHKDVCGSAVGISSGGLATSSTTVRAWTRGGERVHHIIDPASGRSAPVVWRTVSVAAGTCVDANVAATAAIVLGARALAWLERIGLPARLVSADGRVVRIGGWPAEERAS